jgi:AcrR family transcriptional regulator
MDEPAKTRRYDNSRRQAQARATRAEVIDAARRLFLERGYMATTIEAVGQAANIPLATVYRLFGSKRGILSALLDVYFVGDDEPVPLHGRPLARAAIAEPDPRLLLAGFARLAREVLDRSAPIQQVLRSAAAVDSEAADVLDTIRRQRLDGQSRMARALSERDVLADDIRESDAVDIIYALMSTEVYGILTVERGWNPDQYERWLGRTLCAVLLAPAPDRGQGPAPARAE